MKAALEGGGVSFLDGPEAFGLTGPIGEKE
jgi:hypothetical protein